MSTALRSGRRHSPRARSAFALTAQSVWRIALGMVVLQVVLRLLMALGTYFTQDDFVFYTLGATQDLTWDYLFQDRGNHLMPAGQAIVWPLAQWAPLDHTPAVLVTTGLQGLASLAVLGMLREAFGVRPAMLAPLALYLFSVVTLPAFLWWAASLNSIGLQLAMALAVWSHLRGRRLGRARQVVFTALATLLGLTFFEKAVLIPPLLFGLSWVLDRKGGPIRDLFRVLRRYWTTWLTLVVISAGWGLLYLRQVDTGYAVPTNGSITADLVLDSVTKGLLPALFGGPWAWERSQAFHGFIPMPPVALLLASWSVVVIAVLVSLVARRGMARMWLVAAGYVLADLALLAWGRSGAGGALVGLELRYLADASIVLAFAVGFALMPVRGEVAPWRPEVAGLPRWVRRYKAPVGAASAVLLVAWSVTATWSSLQLGAGWRLNPARAYIEGAKDSLAEASDRLVLLDEPVPPDVMLGWFAPLNGTSYALAPLRPRPQFADSVTELYTLNSAGELRPAEVTGVAAEPGPFADCGWAVTSRSTSTITLDRPIYAWNWTVRVDYLAGTDTPATFTLGEGSQTVPLVKGLNTVYFPIVGGGSSVDVSLATAGAGVCIDDLEVGARIVEADETFVPPGQP